MRTIKGSRRDALGSIGTALRTGLAVPDEAMITGDMSLLLARLSGVPYATAALSVSDIELAGAPGES